MWNAFVSHNKTSTLDLDVNMQLSLVTYLIFYTIYKYLKDLVNEKYLKYS